MAARLRHYVSMALFVGMAACTAPVNSLERPDGGDAPQNTAIAPESETLSVESQPPEAVASTDPEVSQNSAIPQLRAVPPAGLNSLSESGFRYFQQMGPLEYAARLSGVPETSTWRVRVRLYPQYEGNDLTYRVKVDHYNLSPALYEDLVQSYGPENTASLFEETAAHQHFQLVFLPIQNVAADWLSELSQHSQSELGGHLGNCGLGGDCAALRALDDTEWAREQSITLAAAPWEQAPEPVYALVRALAAAAGWLQVNGHSEIWSPGEIPEGIREESPWVEIVIDNTIGNGGAYLGEWIEHVADDSVSRVVYQIVYEPRAGVETTARQGFVCARGDERGELHRRCS